ncbi:MAG: hypothetical protein WBW56_01410, partial [Syntrophobacteraceae bacterium]
PETPEQIPRPARFLFEKEAFFVLARKSRGCAEAYMGTASRSVEIMFVPPPKAAAKSAGGPTAPGRKRTLSGWKLI